MDRRQSLLRRLDKAWREFRESCSGLSEADLLIPGVAGPWSVKDLIAHVTTWEEEALKHLPFVLRGERPPRYSVQYGGIDAFNAQTAAVKKNLALADVLRQSDRTHRRLIAFIEKVPEKHLGSQTRFCHRLRLDTYGHYARHTAAIKKWKDNLTNDE